MKNPNVKLYKTTKYIGVNGGTRIVAIGWQRKDVVRMIEKYDGKPWAEIKKYYQIVKADLSYFLKVK